MKLSTVTQLLNCETLSEYNVSEVFDDHVEDERLWKTPTFIKIC